jgi:hypothetical protein
LLGSKIAVPAPPAENSDQTKAEWELVYDLIQREQLSTPREVRLLALVAAVQFDAGIAAADTQYTYWYLRPNMADPTVQPYIPLSHSPAYVSNATIIASAIGELVNTLYPQQAVRFLYLGEEVRLSRVFGDIHYPRTSAQGAQWIRSWASSPCNAIR